MANGLGGVCGGIIGGLTTQYSHPKYLFLGYSLMGLLISYQGYSMNIEAEQTHENNPVRQSLSENMLTIIDAICRPEIFMVLLFFLLDGITSPSFNDFTYYFLINEAKISKF